MNITGCPRSISVKDGIFRIKIVQRPNGPLIGPGRLQASEDSSDNGIDSDQRVDIRSKEITRVQPKTPRMYRVILYNDDYTTMDFVVEILVKVFNKPAAEATKIMLDVHRRGTGTCGVYILDVARTKVDQVHRLARENQFPLRCSYEET